MEILKFNQFINERKAVKMDGVKYIEMTGSPKSAGFSTKAVFLNELQNSGNGEWDQSSMTKRGNIVNILVTNDLSSTTNKMKLAEELGVDVKTYEEMADLFDLQGDL